MKAEYQDLESILEGFLAVPSATSGAKKPAVVIYHGLGLGGLSDFEEGRAEELAKLGFVGFAADLLGKDSRGVDDEKNRALMQQLREDRHGLLRRRLLAALDHIKTYDFVDAERIGVIGYCFGGLCALDVARINVEGVKAVVSFHGTLTPLPDDGTSEKPAIRASVLIAHGDADLYVTQEEYLKFFEEMRLRNADWQFVNYGNAKHGFPEPSLVNSSRPGVGYDEKAARRSWQAMIDLFSESLHHP